MMSTTATPSLELCGFSTDRGCFLLTAARSDCAGSSHSPDLTSGTAIYNLEREFVDLQSWDRLLRHASTGQRLPTKRLRKLMAVNWLRGDTAAGWRRDMQKNVRACEDWLNVAFVQLPVQQQREFLHEGMYAAMKLKRAAALADSKRARELQQYFSSTEMVQLVVTSVQAYLKQRAVVWLEPSCGDGRFLTALLRAGAQHVVGYEIDSKLQSLAERNVRLAASDIAGVPRSFSGEGSSSVQAQVYLGDFLTSKCCVPADKFVVAVGNPPFGTKGKNRTDLVHDFSRHAASEWRARVIAFIVPERCSRPSFVETTLQQLNCQQMDTETVASSWTLAMELPLTDYEFEFGAREALKRVRQPSLLQLFTCDRS
uniref:Site-specific DNA-methyltransferase (adenine-specific) n=1 Tax=Peronospora matthiolae TaxID=2874970 RepID=A0AAV1V275_9STRA